MDVFYSVYISVKYVNDLGDNAAILCNYLVRELEKPNMNFKRVLKDSLGKIVSKENIRNFRNIFVSLSFYITRSKSRFFICSVMQFQLLNIFASFFSTFVDIDMMCFLSIQNLEERPP